MLQGQNPYYTSNPYFAFMLLLYSVALIAVLFLVWYSEKLTLAGTAVAGILAVAIYAGAGWCGIALLGAFFIMGTVATRWQKERKEGAGLVEAGSSRRSAGQVLANGGVAGVCSLWALFFPQHSIAVLWMVGGAFSAAAADTLASELGMVYGRRFFNIRTLRPDEKGLNGVVSLEGTLLGMAGSMIIGLVLWAGSGVQVMGYIVLAGTAGNVLDSWLGATLERKGALSNNGVNAANTAAGALVMLLCYYLRH